MRIHRFSLSFIYLKRLNPEKIQFAENLCGERTSCLFCSDTLTRVDSRFVFKCISRAILTYTAHFYPRWHIYMRLKFYSKCQCRNHPKRLPRERPIILPILLRERYTEIYWDISTIILRIFGDVRFYSRLTHHWARGRGRWLTQRWMVHRCNCRNRLAALYWSEDVTSAFASPSRR